MLEHVHGHNSGRVKRRLESFFLFRTCRIRSWVRLARFDIVPENSLGTKLPCRPVQTSLGHMSDIRIQSPDLALDTCLLGTENNRGERPVQLDQEYNIYRSIALPNRRYHLLDICLLHRSGTGRCGWERLFYTYILCTRVCVDVGKRKDDVVGFGKFVSFVILQFQNLPNKNKNKIKKQKNKKSKKQKYSHCPVPHD